MSPKRCDLTKSEKSGSGSYACSSSPTRFLVEGVRRCSIHADFKSMTLGNPHGYRGLKRPKSHDGSKDPLLPDLAAPVLPLWLTVHRELRTSTRLRLVSDFLAQAIPEALAVGQSPLPVPDGPAAALA